VSAALVALALRTLGPCPDARPIAEAIALAVDREDTPTTGSRELDAALLAVYARHESSGMLTPWPQSWDARAGVSCGPWQMRCVMVAGKAASDQASTWLRLVRVGGLAMVDSSRKRALARMREAERAVGA
jgi:hypothetical protein